MLTQLILNVFAPIYFFYIFNFIIPYAIIVYVLYFIAIGNEFLLDVDV